MSLSFYFFEKCAKKIEENYSLILKKFNDPSNFIQISASDQLKAAATGNMGALADLAGNYIEQNADSLLLKALEVTGLENSVLDALNLLYNLIAQSVAAYNDLILLFLKKLAGNIIVELNKKAEINATLKQKLTNLHNALLALNAGDPVFEKYLSDLRAALADLEYGRRDVLLVRNTVKSSDRFLGKRYKSGKAKVESALGKIRPLDNNPYLKPTAKGLLTNLGIPNSDEQINNMLAIPSLCRDVIAAAQGYDEAVLKINTMLTAYYNGLSQLQTVIPSAIKKYILSRFDSTLDKLLALTKSMSLNLNGSESLPFSVAPGFKATPLNVSVQAFKWLMDSSLILESFKLIPAGHIIVERQANGWSPAKTEAGDGKRLLAAMTGQFRSVNVGDSVEIFNTTRPGIYRVKKLISNAEVELDRVINNSIQRISPIDYEITSDALGALQLNFETVDVYRASVSSLKRMGTVNNGKSALVADEAKENSVAFMGQLFTFLLEATNAVVSSSVRAEALSLCRSFIKRADLVESRDRDIATALTAFINAPIPFEDTINSIFNAIKKALSDLGLDRASDLLDSGEFEKFFKLNSKNATYVGAALEAIAFLKDCFDNDADKAKLSEIENEVQGDADLLSFSISFNFDLAIFKNLQDCLSLNGFGDLFNSKEIICGLLEKSGVGTLFNKLNDLLKF